MRSKIMRKQMEIYDYNEGCFISGEFRSIRELDTGAQLGYFESAEYANRQAIIVRYSDGTYFVVERLKGMATKGAS
jgi:hypothetical protein